MHAKLGPTTHLCDPGGNVDSTEAEFVRPMDPHRGRPVLPSTTVYSASRLRASKTTHRVVHCTKSKPSPTAESTANCVPHGQSEWFPHLTSPVPHQDVERCPRRTPTKRLDVHPARAIYEVRSLVPNPSIVQAILEKKLKAEERRRDLAISKVLSECEGSTGDVSRNETSPSTDSLDSSRIRAFSKLVRRRCYSLPELVELVRGQTTQDRRPNKALCPQRYELLLRGYRHQRLLQSIATTGICPGWLRPGPHQKSDPPTITRPLAICQQ